jgi:hypothetical protein
VVFLGVVARRECNSAQMNITYKHTTTNTGTILEECNWDNPQQYEYNCTIEAQPPQNLPNNLMQPIELIITCFICPITATSTSATHRSYIVVPVPPDCPNPARPVLVTSEQINACTIFNDESVDLDIFIKNVSIFYKYLHKLGPVSISTNDDKQDALEHLYDDEGIPFSTAQHGPLQSHNNSATQTTSIPKQYHTNTNLFVLLPKDTPLPTAPIFVPTRCSQHALTIYNAASVNVDVLCENILRNYYLLIQHYKYTSMY